MYCPYCHMVGDNQINEELLCKNSHCFSPRYFDYEFTTMFLLFARRPSLKSLNHLTLVKKNSRKIRWDCDTDQVCEKRSCCAFCVNSPPLRAIRVYTNESSNFEQYEKFCLLFSHISKSNVWNFWYQVSSFVESLKVLKLKVYY